MSVVTEPLETLKQAVAGLTQYRTRAQVSSARAQAGALESQIWAGSAEEQGLFRDLKAQVIAMEPVAEPAE